MAKPTLARPGKPARAKIMRAADKRPVNAGAAGGPADKPRTTRLPRKTPVKTATATTTRPRKPPAIKARTEAPVAGRAATPSTALKSGKPRAPSAGNGAKVAAAVSARKKTMERTLRFPGDGDLVCD